MTDDTYDLPDENLEAPLDPRLLDLARGYHPPPATPRDAMWARIVAARQAPVIPIDAARARRGRPRSWAVVAAALAAGVAFGALGVKLMQPTAATGPVVATAGTQPRAVPATAATPVDTGSRVPTVVATATPTTPTPRVVRTAPRGGPPAGNIAPKPAPAVTDYAQREPESRPRDASSLYRAAAVQTLSQAELLLVAWRTDAPRDSASARQLGAWARDVLGSTRLLLDSPAARDPQLHALLDDLELVLAQIVQLSGSPLTPGERALLERSVRARDLLPRIRSVVPAGAAAI